MLGGSPSPKVNLQAKCWNPGTGVPAGSYPQKDTHCRRAGADTEGLAGLGHGVGLQGSPSS